MSVLLDFTENYIEVAYGSNLKKSKRFSRHKFNEALAFAQEKA